jgi:hypothetical protein
MTSLPERTPKKTTVPSIVALLSSGYKQAFPLLTVDLQRARHNNITCVCSSELTFVTCESDRVVRVALLICDLFGWFPCGYNP